MIYWILLVVAAQLVGVVRSLRIESEDLWMGDWEARIRCSPSWFDSELFPPPQQEVQKRQDCKSKPSETIRRPFRISEHRRRTFPCRLSLYPNGTFTLVPTGDGLQLSSSHLNVNGRWTLLKNPYCVTDRFYDEIRLDAYPRIQSITTTMRHNVDASSSTLDTTAAPVSESSTSTRVDRMHQQLTFQCRMSGHFSAGRVRWGPQNRGTNVYAQGKLTHGIVLAEVETKNKDPEDVEAKQGPQQFLRRKLLGPRIAATFSAKRIIPTKTALHNQLEAYDNQEFGY